VIVPSRRGWTLVLKNLRSTVDRRLSTVFPTVQVSDTTGDAMKYKSPSTKNIQHL